MEQIDFRRLKQTFLDVLASRGKYQVLKRIDEFNVDGQYVGDMFNYTIFEDNGSSAPTFFQINSPYDTHSKKAPQQALVFSNGMLTQNLDFTTYVKARTALLDAMFLELIANNIADKKVFMFGSGNVARYSLVALSQLLGLTKLAYLNTHGADESFEAIAKENNVETTFAEFGSSDWDIVIMHTPGNTPLISKTHLDNVKPGTILMTYADGVEVESECYSPQKANLVIDYANNLKLAKDTAKALETRICTENDFTVLLDILSGDGKLELNSEKYTIFRSKGTPYQNVAMLKYLNS